MKQPLESIDVITEPQIRLRPRILNDAIGNLLIPQQISLFHGPERAPLSILAHSAIVSAARMDDASCIFLDSGTNYSSTLVKSLCHIQDDSSKILEKIAVGQVFGLIDVVEKIEMLSDFGEVSLMVLDSLTGALNLTGDPGSRGRQRNLFSALDSIRRVINDIDTHVMITDHSSRNWTSGQPTPIGGNVLAHAVDSVVSVERLREGDDVVRILVERCTLPSPPAGVIVRIGTGGIRSIR
ncbi:MAG: hypothetical protein MUP60_00830 [Candidatus Thorarchaeota archaeon]|nr:hypothetical protein [Candidatus Thorarchaeota archaeon]